MKSVTIVGAGRVGGALAIALKKAGYGIDGFVVRKPNVVLSSLRQIDSRPWENIIEIKSDIILITTQDSEIVKPRKY